MDNYKTAPTFLYNTKGESKAFHTQDEVDAAWKDGWFGPPWAVQGKGPLSSLVQGEDFETKKDYGIIIDDDPRYKGFKPNLSRSVLQIKEALVKFEVETGIIEVDDDDDNS